MLLGGSSNLGHYSRMEETNIFEFLFGKLSSEFWSAIGGAVVGGGIAYVMQVKSLREAKKDREQEKKERRTALGYSILFKMIRIHSNLHNVDHFIEESFLRAEKEGLKGDSWRFVKAFANIPDKVRFSAEELSLVMSFQDDDLSNSILFMDAAHNGLLDILTTFSISRNALAGRLSARMQGDLAISEFTKDEMLTLGPKMAEVSFLIDDMRARAKIDLAAARIILQKVHSVSQRKLGIKFNLKIPAAT